MRRHVPALLTSLLLCGAGCLLTSGVLGPLLARVSAIQAAVPGVQAHLCTQTTSCPIQHVVIIIKENRTFDNLFGQFPGADGATWAQEGSRKVKMGETADKMAFDIYHLRGQVLQAWNGGRMDQFYRLPGAFQFGQDYADSQFHQKDIPNYWQYAKTFSLADHMFSSLMTASYGNHMALITGSGYRLTGIPY